jgi:ATP-dependent DNA helicase RecG
LNILDITQADAEKIIGISESHFYDFKSKRDNGRSTQKTTVGLANADGGEIYVGVEDSNLPNETSLDRWQGFSKPEDANQLIQTIVQDVRPSPPTEFEFYRIASQYDKGLVLKINVLKSAEVHRVSDGTVYVRKGAHNLKIEGDSITI